jgi:hypothetical protein
MTDITKRERDVRKPSNAGSRLPWRCPRLRLKQCLFTALPQKADSAALLIRSRGFVP